MGSMFHLPYTRFIVNYSIHSWLCICGRNSFHLHFESNFVVCGVWFGHIQSNDFWWGHFYDHVQRVPLATMTTLLTEYETLFAQLSTHVQTAATASITIRLSIESSCSSNLNEKQKNWKKISISFTLNWQFWIWKTHRSAVVNTKNINSPTFEHGWNWIGRRYAGRGETCFTRLLGNKFG